MTRFLSGISTLFLVTFVTQGYAVTFITANDGKAPGGDTTESSHLAPKYKEDEFGYMEKALGPDDAEIAMGIKYYETKLLSKSGPYSPLEIMSAGVSVYKGFSNHTGNTKVLNSEAIRAIVFLAISNDLHKEEVVAPDDEIRWIGDLVILLRGIAKSFIMAGGSPKSIAVRLSFEYMKLAFDRLHEVIGCTEDSFVLVEAQCLHCLSWLSSDMGKYHHGLRYAHKGITILEDHFGVNATDYRYYFKLMNVMGTGYYRLGEFAEAEESYLKSIDAFGKCKEFSSKFDRLIQLYALQGNLKTARYALGKFHGYFTHSVK